MTRIKSSREVFRQLLLPVDDCGPALSADQQRELVRALAELLLSAAADEGEQPGDDHEHQDRA